MRPKSWLVGLALAAALGWLAIPLGLLPVRSALAGSPADVGLGFETVRIEVGAARVPLVAWWIPTRAARGSVVLLHDGSSNRSFLWSNGLALARALHEQGYHVLAPDLRGHGDSGDAGGTPVGGDLAQDVPAWLDEIERRAGALPIGAVGFGLGGQVAIYAGASDTRIRAVVADSTWADLESSLRVSLPSATGMPQLLVRSLLWSARHIHGIDFSQGRAVDVVAALSGRLLLITNEEDPQVPRRQLRWLAREAGVAEVWVSPAPPPEHPLYASAGTWGTHSRTNVLYPEEYAERVGAFLGERME